MLSNRIAFAALAMVCIGAAAGGGYLARRQALPATTATLDDTTRELAEPAKAVQETEAVVTPPADLTTPAETTTPPPAPAPRRAAPRPVQNSKTRSARASDAPALNSTWPTGSNTTTQPPSAPADTSASNTPAPVESRPTFTELMPAPAPQPTFEELVVSADSVVGLQPETGSAANARRRGRVEARVVRDVRVGGRWLFRPVHAPPGPSISWNAAVSSRIATALGSGFRRWSWPMAHGCRSPPRRSIATATPLVTGRRPDRQAAVAGAIIGGIIGGGRVGHGRHDRRRRRYRVVMAGDRRRRVPAGADVTARILSPVTVTVDR